MELVLSKINGPGSSTINLNHPLPETERVGRVQAELLKGSQVRSINLIYKRPTHIDCKPDGTQLKDDEYAHTYGQIWLRFKEAGIPTIPTMRIASDNLVLMTDLEADGSKLYDKLDKFLLDFDRRVDTPKLFEKDRQFLEIPPAAILDSAKTIFDRASASNIVLPTDEECLSILSHPNGSWELLVVDLECARFEYDATDTNRYTREDFSRFIHDYRRGLRQYYNFGV